MKNGISSRSLEALGLLYNVNAPLEALSSRQISLLKFLSVHACLPTCSIRCLNILIIVIKTKFLSDRTNVW